MAQLLMPKATAVWLVDNTSLSFEQVGDFCTMHPLEIKAIADAMVASVPVERHHAFAQSIAGMLPDYKSPAAAKISQS